MPGIAFESRDLGDFRRELKEIDPAYPKELAKANKSIGTDVAKVARGNAAAEGGIWAKGAKGIKGYGSQTSAGVGVTSGGIPSVAFWGAKRRTGWFADPKYGDYPSQHPPWVGNAWDAATPTGGPYVINRTLYRETDRVEETYLGMLDELTARAFPD